MRLSLWLVFAAIVIAILAFVRIYRVLFSPSVHIPEGKSIVFYVPTGSEYEDVIEKLHRTGYYKRQEKF